MQYLMTPPPLSIDFLATQGRGGGDREDKYNYLRRERESDEDDEGRSGEEDAWGWWRRGPERKERTRKRIRGGRDGPRGRGRTSNYG